MPERSLVFLHLARRDLFVSLFAGHAAKRKLTRNIMKMMKCIYKEDPTFIQFMYGIWLFKQGSFAMFINLFEHCKR